jgi:hypothetical protein
LEIYLVTLIPDKFYKYRTLSAGNMERVERTVLHSEVYFAPASTFNDPFDLRAVFDFEATPDQQRADFLRLSRQFAPHLSEAQHQTAANEVMANALSPQQISFTTNAFQALYNRMMAIAVGVYCVSTKCDDVLMWAHYADSHTGVCLEFDGLSDLMGRAHPINYVADRPSISPYRDSHLTMMERALLTKAEQWRYEFEWRLLREEGPAVVRFEPANLTGIIIGALAPVGTVEKIRTWSRERHVPIRLSRAMVDHKQFQLNIVPLS